MSVSELSALNALTVAGPTFAFGMIFGWVLAVFIFGGSSGPANHHDDDDR